MSQVSVIYPTNLTATGVLTPTASLPISAAFWTSTRVFSVGELVRYFNGGAWSLYRCLVYGASATTPNLSPTRWVFVGGTPLIPWQPSTSYGVNDTVTHGTFVYECIVPVNAVIDPSVDTTKWRKSTRDYPYWVPETNYAIGERICFFNEIYECLIAGVSSVLPSKAATNSKPALSTASQKWLHMQKANAWLAFDGYSHTATRAYGSTMQFDIKPNTAVSAIAITGLVATSITVSATVIATGVPLFNETITLTGVTVDRIRDVDNKTTYYKEFAHTAGLAITITINRPGYEPQCGAVVVGAMQKIGDASSGVHYGATVTTSDYTKTLIDDFGTVTVVRRPWTREVSVQLLVPNELIAGTQELIAFLRASVCMWRLADVSDALLVQGLARGFSATIAYPTHSLMQLTIKGVV